MRSLHQHRHRLSSLPQRFLAYVSVVLAHLLAVVADRLHDHCSRDAGFLEQGARSMTLAPGTPVNDSLGSRLAQVHGAHSTQVCPELSFALGHRDVCIVNAHRPESGRQETCELPQAHQHSPFWK